MYIHATVTSLLRLMLLLPSQILWTLIFPAVFVEMYTRRIVTKE